MAQQIQLGLGTYLIDFSGGQAGLRTPPYVQYTTDFDTNFVTLRNTINQIITELNAVQGPNAGLGIDLLVFDDPNRAGGTALSGIVGEHSFLTEIDSPNTQLAVEPGVAVVNQLAVRNNGGATLVGSGSSGQRYVAVDNNGALFLETALGQRALDLYEVTWNGTIFTGTPTLLPAVFFDGDAWDTAVDRAVESPTWAAKRYNGVAGRLRAVERLLAGLATDADGDPVGPLVHPDGSAGSPGATFRTQQNLGMYRASADVLGFATGGSARVQIRSSGLRSHVDGSAGTPSWSWTGDPDTGVYTPGGNRLGFATGGQQAAELDAQGNLDLPRNSRVKGLRTTVQSIPDATPTLIDFNAADEFDVGGWHDHASGTLATRQQFTCPTGHDGLFHARAALEFADPTNLTDLTVEITLNGSTVAKKEHDTERNATLEAATYLELSAGDVLRVQVTQNDTVGAASLDVERAEFTLVKEA